MNESPTADGDASHPVIRFYWRPGCVFCMMLDRKLGRTDLPVERVNIWEEPEAAAAVRAITGGSETVPTVVVGAEAMVNPRASEVVAAFERCVSGN